MVKRIERLASIEPTDEELQKGRDLRGALMELSGTLDESRLSILDGAMELTPRQGDHLLVLPSDWIKRWRLGTRETGDSSFYTILNPEETRTRTPFIMSRFSLIGAGFSPMKVDDEVPKIEGYSPTWEWWPDAHTREELRYKYSFDLAAHTLAVVNQEYHPTLFE
jgi:hypothetical protein